MKLRHSSFLLAATGLLSLGCFASQYRSNPRVAIVDGDPIVQMKPLGKLPSANDPPVVSLARHSDPPEDRERLIGLIGPNPRAYPIGLLDRFEVVNDSAGEPPFVVVRCALTHVAAVYERRLEGRVLTFENSGALWRDTLVLRDRETGTLWSAATGAALDGPLAGRRLSGIPAIYATAEAWRRAYPDSVYMDLGRPTSVPFLMRLYGASPWQGVSGIKTRDRRHKPKEEFLSVGRGREALAFTDAEIRRRGGVRTTLAGETVAIEWDQRLQTPRAFSFEGPVRREAPVLPMYWFALDRHFERVRTLAETASSPRPAGSPGPLPRNRS